MPTEYDTFLNAERQRLVDDNIAWPFGRVLRPNWFVYKSLQHDHFSWFGIDSNTDPDQANPRPNKYSMILEQKEWRRYPVLATDVIPAWSLLECASIVRPRRNFESFFTIHFNLAGNQNTQANLTTATQQIYGRAHGGFRKSLYPPLWIFRSEGTKHQTAKRPKFRKLWILSHTNFANAGKKRHCEIRKASSNHVFLTFLLCATDYHHIFQALQMSKHQSLTDLVFRNRFKWFHFLSIAM